MPVKDIYIVSCAFVFPSDICGRVGHQRVGSDVTRARVFWGVFFLGVKTYFKPCSDFQVTGIRGVFPDAISVGLSTNQPKTT